MTIMEQLSEPAVWQAFLDAKRESRHLSDQAYAAESTILMSDAYKKLVANMQSGHFESPFPQKREINKQGTHKKRVIYTFEPEMNEALRLMGYLLYRYDGLMADNCYAFRRHRSVKDAVQRLQTMQTINQQFCLKVDIHDYFNSIDVDKLLVQLQFMQQEDGDLLQVLRKILKADAAYLGKTLIHEKRGAMAGTPISPFLANVYLMQVDHVFEKQNAQYFRYSDDILIFAETKEALIQHQQYLYCELERLGLTLNPDKVKWVAPGEHIDFLGITYQNGQVKLSKVTKDKLKGKIRRKARALRRWAEEKHIGYDKAAIGLIRAINRKLYEPQDENTFCWSRWFFPLLTTSEDLKEIDTYIQQALRYCVTGKHSKTNYRISYDQLKAWGYQSLVHAYYRQKKEK